MRKPRIVAAVAAGAVVILTPAVARAHFVLEAPSWAVQDGKGQPQKTAPCGQADPQTAAVPTGVATPFDAGQAITPRSPVPYGPCRGDWGLVMAEHDGGPPFTFEDVGTAMAGSFWYEGLAYERPYTMSGKVEPTTKLTRFADRRLA